MNREKYREESKLNEKKVYLENLQVRYFMHEKEMDAQNKMMGNKHVRNIIEKTCSVVADYQSAMRLGKYVRLTERTTPKLFIVLEDVCKILNYEAIPEVYTTRLRYYDVTACQAEMPFIVVPDLLLETLDTDMLYYALGNAITMIKAGHAEISMVANFVPSNMITMAPKLLIMNFLHIADMTSDRGGLLACQSFAAAVRCHLLEMGIAPSMVYHYADTDRKAEMMVEKLLESRLEEGTIRKTFRTIQDYYYFEGAALNMLEDLYRWYKDPKGYHKILSIYGKDNYG